MSYSLDKFSIFPIVFFKRNDKILKSMQNYYKLEKNISPIIVFRTRRVIVMGGGDPSYELTNHCKKLF